MAVVVVVGAGQQQQNGHFCMWIWVAWLLFGFYPLLVQQEKMRVRGTGCFLLFGYLLWHQTTSVELGMWHSQLKSKFVRFRFWISNPSNSDVNEFVAISNGVCAVVAVKSLMSSSFIVYLSLIMCLIKFTFIICMHSASSKWKSSEGKMVKMFAFCVSVFFVPPLSSVWQVMCCVFVRILTKTDWSDGNCRADW